MSLAFKRRWGWDRKQRRPAKIFGWCGVVRFGPCDALAVGGRNEIEGFGRDASRNLGSEPRYRSRAVLYDGRGAARVTSTTCSGCPMLRSPRD
jgi:hypothetical protein